MNNNIVRVKRPEERELETKLADLEVLENQLAELELEKATLQGNLRSFEARYIQTVGRLYAELDQVEAEIAELMARAEPANEKLRYQAEEARTTAEETAREARFYASQMPTADFKPSGDLKKLYREIVKRIHPDLGKSDEDRTRRHLLMVEVNSAYEAGNEACLRAISENLSEEIDAQSDDIGTKLIRAIRKIAHASTQIETIKMEIDKLRHADLFSLFTKWKVAETEGRDLLEEMAATANSQLIQKRQSLIDLKVRQNYA